MITLAVRRAFTSPSLAGSVVLLLVAGLGNNILAWMLAYSVTTRPLPYENADRLVELTFRSPQNVAVATPALVYELAQSQSSWISSVTLFNFGDAIIRLNNGEQRTLRAAWVTPSFFETVSPSPPLPLPRLTEAGVLVSQATAAPLGLLGDTSLHRLVVNGRSVEVVGVFTGHFHFPAHEQPDLILLAPKAMSHTSGAHGTVIAQLQPGISLKSAATPVAILGEDVVRLAPPSVREHLAAGARLTPVSLSESLYGDANPFVWTFTALSTLLLASSSTAIAALTSVALMRRRRALVTMFALGATSFQAMASPVGELAVLVGTGLAVAVTGTYACSGLLLAYFTGALARTLPMRLDTVDLAVAISIGLLAAVSCTVTPLMATWREWRRIQTPGNGTSSPEARRRPFEHAAILFAVSAVSVVSIAVAFSLATSLAERLNAAFRGYHPQNVTTARLSLATGRLEPWRQLELIDAVEAHASRAAADVGLTTSLPTMRPTFEFETFLDHGSGAAPIGTVGVEAVSPTYFRALGASVTEGREFLASDSATSLPVAVVNSAFRRRYLHGALSSWRLGLGGGDNIIIIGVIATLGVHNDAERPLIYRPLSQAYPQLGWHTLYLVLHRAPYRAGLLDGLQRTAAREAWPIVAYDEQGLTERVARREAVAHSQRTISQYLALLCLAVMSGSVMAVTAFVAEQQRRPVAIRAALGATYTQIFMLTLKAAYLPVVSGAMCGALAATGVTSIMAPNGRTSTCFVHSLSAAAVTVLVGFGSAACVSLRSASVVRGVAGALREE